MLAVGDSFISRADLLRLRLSGCVAGVLAGRDGESGCGTGPGDPHRRSAAREPSRSVTPRQSPPLTRAAR